MARTHIVKCLYCGKSFDTETEEYVKPRSNRYAHKACHDKLQASKSQDDLDRDELEAYIKDLLRINSISLKIKRQIETYHDKDGHTYSTILKALKYFYEVRGNTTEKANGGIGIVPYIVEESSRYWYALWEARQRNEDIDIEDFILPQREIHIQQPQRQPMKHLRKLFTFLDEDGEDGL